MNRFKIPRDLQNEQWVRMPKPKGQLPGLSRTTLLEVAERQEIKIANVRKPGSIREFVQFDLDAQPSRTFGARYEADAAPDGVHRIEAQAV